MCLASTTKDKNLITQIQKWHNGTTEIENDLWSCIQKSKAHVNKIEGEMRICKQSGIVDSIKYLLNRDNYTQRSDLIKLLTRAFEKKTT